jgi:hypothetical protein
MLKYEEMYVEFGFKNEKKVMVGIMVIIKLIL